jgi:hypothetical protein
MTQNASTRGDTACFAAVTAFFNLTEAIRDNSSLCRILRGCGQCISTPAARTAAAGDISAAQSNTMLSLGKKRSTVLQGGIRFGQTTKLPRHGPHLPMPCRTQDGFLLHPDRI